MPRARNPNRTPAQGPGWGGPAKGAGRSKAPKAELFKPGHKLAAGPHDFTKSERREMMLRVYESIADNSEQDMARIAAATAWLDRHEGKPVARVDARITRPIEELSDAELSAIVLEQDASLSVN